MYCVVYEFKVNVDQNAIFEEAWRMFTKAIYEKCGSLGSRLHKTDDPLVYIAYAQWPSKDIFDGNRPEPDFNQKEIEFRNAMKDSTTSIKKIHLLESIDDQLNFETHTHQI